ncbi:galactose mutarotase [Oribacterium sp. oral taxon 102]|uniref:aldose epimerase family protein n=1 Tax=Oribacterium sp. oral taxon 102 TaxID=671214 RepID=UPI0015BBB5D1|nr:aldose epimerase family protein [Oribacterium sp. oral taxon 102]NWO21520.1 galactose mutarotase [Oribacterium sp. oral taxon 102]
MAVRVSVLGSLPDGREVHKYTLVNGRGSEAAFTDLGAIWTNMRVRDRDGVFRDVVLGCDKPEALLRNPGHMGAVVGRNANRIGGGSYMLNGVSYTLEKNDKGVNNLHSGPNFWERRSWAAEYGDKGTGAYVMFSLHSESMEQGYPGNAEIAVIYTLSEDDALSIEYRGVSDCDTILNMTNHAYFNLNGCDAGDASSQYVQIHASYFTPASESSVPYGELAPVSGTPMDFRTEKRIGRDIGAEYEQLRFGGGYDHNYCVDGTAGEQRLAAAAYAEESGIEMKVYTDLEGLQFYTANFLNVRGDGKNGASYSPRTAYCFETQHYPDAINKPAFPSPVVRAGEEYRTETVYCFGIRG